MNKKLQGVLAVAIVIAISASFFFPSGTTVVERVVGAVSGPDFYFDYFGVNDVLRYPSRKTLVLATTTPCAIKSPSATSTLLHTSLQIIVASSTATVWTVAKAASGFATTTPLRNNISLGSGAFGSMLHVASTSVVAIDSVDVFAPNTYLVWSKSGDTPAGSGLAGVCQAEFLRI